MLVIPSSTLRSRYIRTIPIGTVVKDPVNGHAYLIEEKKLNNNSLVKVATPYIGNNQKGIDRPLVNERPLR